MCHCHQNIDDNDDDDVVAAVVDDLDESQLPCENSVQDIKDHAALVQQIRHLNSVVHWSHCLSLKLHKSKISKTAFL